jgi:sulfur-oxidizing protein SoxY
MASLGIAARAAATDAGVRADPFLAQTLAELIGSIGGAPRPSPFVTLEAPDVAADGGFVPITVSSALPGTRELLLLVERNPQPLALRIEVSAGTEAFVATRIRMAASGMVLAAVRTDDGLFGASRTVEVSVGGCG